MLKIGVALQRARLCDFVQEVLDVAVPELADLGLFRSAGCAVNEPETFDFIEDLSIKVACKCRRRTWTELVGLLQGKWRDLGPLGKIRWREIRRRQLVVSGLGSRHVRRWSYIRSIGAARSEKLAGNCLPNGYSLGLSLIIGKQRQVLLQFRIQRRLKRRVQEHEDIMSCLIGRSYLGRAPRNVGKAHKVRTEPWVDIIDGIINGGVQNCETTSGVNGSWLSAGRANDRQKGSIPLDHCVDRLGRILLFVRRCIRKRSDVQERAN